MNSAPPEVICPGMLPEKLFAASTGAQYGETQNGYIGKDSRAVIAQYD
jgi:hypothetical protein